MPLWGLAFCNAETWEHCTLCISVDHTTKACEDYESPDEDKATRSSNRHTKSKITSSPGWQSNQVPPLLPTFWSPQMPPIYECQTAWVKGGLCNVHWCTGRRRGQERTEYRHQMSCINSETCLQWSPWLKGDCVMCSPNASPNSSTLSSSSVSSPSSRS